MLNRKCCECHTTIQDTELCSVDMGFAMADYCATCIVIYDELQCANEFLGVDYDENEYIRGIKQEFSCLE